MIGIKVTNENYYDMISEYKFILSPPGAGIDCHRTWEALYIGCVPIVIESSISELYQDLPILVIKDWKEINEHFLNKKWEEIVEKKKLNKYNMKKITSSYWTTKIKSKFKKKNRKKKVIHFITYGDEKFSKSKKRLLKEAEEFGKFKTIKGYGPEDLPKGFIKRFEDILKKPRGGGYWLWRPMILLDSLKKIENNEFLVYLDAGCALNKQGEKRFLDYITLLDKSDYGILSFQMSGNNGPGLLEKEKWWSIKEIFNHFEVDIDGKEANSGQYLGGVFIMKKNKHLDQYMKSYIESILKNPYYCTDKYNNQNQITEFRENRHEQSVSSILRKKIGSVVIDGDESWFPPFGQGKSLEYPFWATRLRE